MSKRAVYTVGRFLKAEILFIGFTCRKFGQCGCHVEKKVKMVGDNRKNAIWALLIPQLVSDTDMQMQPIACKPNTEQTFAANRVPPFETFLPLFKRTREDISVDRGSSGSKLQSQTKVVGKVVQLNSSPF